MKALCIAFSMYSKIPVPRVEWNEKNMRYALCYFPWIGLVIGLLEIAWNMLCARMSFGSLFCSCGAFALPLLITGGIHMDGYLDTIDAIHSYGDREKRLAILKDSNSGAFAIIYGLLYLVCSLGVWSELSKNALPFVGVVFILSRTLSGLSVVLFPKAKHTGLAATFQDAAHRRNVGIVLVLYLLAEVAFLCYMGWMVTAALSVCGVLLFVWYYHLCKHMFGGITGDLAGFFLQVFELTGVAVCMFVCRMW